MVQSSLPRVFADFQNADRSGRVRLNCSGTMEDLGRQQIELRDGLLLELYSDDAGADGQPDDLYVTARVEYSPEERGWVAVIDWDAIRHESGRANVPLPFDVVRLVDDLFEDLQLVASTSPNERLPKEEQIRCSIYTSLRQHFRVVCAERGYRPIDEKGRTECDLWAAGPNGPSVWIEFKRCWSVRGWVNKAPEQLGDWQADVGKLEGVPPDSDRYFLMLGLFDFDPSHPTNTRSQVLANIRSFYSDRLLHHASSRFAWRDEAISHIGAWVWRWEPGQPIRPTARESSAAAPQNT